MFKVFASVAAVLTVVFGLVFLTMYEKVEAGFVGIKVNLLGTEKGVEMEELGVGRYFIGINEELYLFPTFAVNTIWDGGVDAEGNPVGAIKFQSVEGMEIAANVGITFSIDPSKVPVLFQRYRKGIEEISDIYLRNMVRDAFVNATANMSVNSIYGTGKSDLMTAVEARVRDQVAVYGILIERIYLNGSMILPPEVTAAISGEITANSEARQRENQIASAKADAQKAREIAQGNADAILIEARAQAEANKLLSESLTADLLQSQAIESWDGVLPRMTGSAAVPMINVDTITGGN